MIADLRVLVLPMRFGKVLWRHLPAYSKIKAGSRSSSLNKVHLVMCVSASVGEMKAYMCGLICTESEYATIASTKRPPHQVDDHDHSLSFLVHRRSRLEIYPSI